MVNTLSSLLYTRYVKFYINTAVLSLYSCMWYITFSKLGSFSIACILLFTPPEFCLVEEWFLTCLTHFPCLIMELVITVSWSTSSQHLKHLICLHPYWQQYQSHHAQCPQSLLHANQIRIFNIYFVLAKKQYQLESCLTLYQNKLLYPLINVPHMLSCLHLELLPVNV